MASGHKGVKSARFDLIPQDALWLVAKVFGKGAEKYAERNWERGLKYTSIAGARDRHNALFAAGQHIDEESGLPHLAHAAWHALVMLALFLRGKLEDDRGGELWQTMTAEVTNPEDIEAARAEVEAIRPDSTPRTIRELLAREARSDDARPAYGSTYESMNRGGS